MEDIANAVAAAVATNLQDQGYNARITRLEARVVTLEQQVSNQAVTIQNLRQDNRQLSNMQNMLSRHETAVSKVDRLLTMQEKAAYMQANSLGSVLGRGDSDPLRTLAKRLLDPEDFGYSVTAEVRNAARRALGMPEVKEYDL